MMTDNISFKGYKNVFCAFDVPFSKAKTVTFLSMQLNDEDGHNDLSEYRKLKEMQGDIINQKYGDVLTLSYVVDKAKMSDHIFLDLKEMYWGDELRDISEKYVPKMMSREKYQQEQALHMKAYTLLASLTKRMINDAFSNEDCERVRVIERMYNNMYAIVKNQEEAFRLTEIACLKKVKFQNIAEGFNKGIVETMQKFFR